MPNAKKLQEVTQQLSMPAFYTVHITTKMLDIRVEPDPDSLGSRRFRLTSTPIRSDDTETHEDLTAEQLHRQLQRLVGDGEYGVQFRPFVRPQSRPVR